MATRLPKLLVAIVPTLLWANAFQNAAPAQEPAKVSVAISGGSVAGVYTHVAKTLCTILEQTHPAQYVCTGRTGLGSVFNVNALKRDLVDFGLVQSDRHWQAWNGTGEWKDQPTQTVRSVFSLHDEVVHIIARTDSGIETITDLMKKRVNIGNLSSGQRANTLEVLALYGIDANTDIDSFSYQQGNAYHAYGDHSIDAFFYTVGLPSRSIAQVVKEIPSNFIPLDEAVLAPLIENAPYYVMTKIPRGIYKGVNEAVTTLGVKATLMTSENTPDDLVYDLTKAYFENIDAVTSSHPALANVTARNARDGLIAPLHPGARKYYQEQGWLN